MRILFYFLLTYLFLPINSAVDLLTILVYFVVLNEDEKFSILFAFFVGLMIDLYYPVSLGVNMLIFLVLSQGLVFIKKYFVREPLTLFIVFVIFYFIKFLFANIIPGRIVMWNTIFFTLIFALPALFILHKICFRVWIRT
jgi:rod shape-determining protein MreD|uniref:Rod shape-determining protein MreD n=1 Tax=candidate division WOR-3 bacterium TaxID=2052148 RepID=A0A7C6AGV5_UNCW3